MNRARTVAFVFLLFLAFSFARPAAAQAPLEPSRLPARTVFYLVWRGMPAGTVRQANSLFALWDDPGFAPVRDAMAENLFDPSKQKDSRTPPLTRAEWEEYLPLFDNSYIFGFLTNPQKRSAPASSASGAKPPQWNGVFFVYDRTGKEALLAKVLLRMRSSKTESSEMTPATIAGIPALKFSGKTGDSYWVEKGKYVVSTSERSVMEEILARLDGKTTGGSLGESAAFQEAQPHLGKGTLELFLRIPDLKEFAADIPPQQGLKVGPVLDAIRLDAIHSLYGEVSFEGAHTRLHGAILGDTSAGTLFDIFADGQPSVASLAFASSDTIYFNSSQFNFPGIYATIKRAMRSVFPQGQQGNVDMIDSLAQARLGMPVADALALLTGEFASFQSSPTMDSEKQVYFLGIRNKEDTLKLIRTVFGDQVGSERNEGDTTFLKISLGGGQSRAGVAQWNFYHVAVTPNAVLGASRAETLRQVLAQRAQGAAAGVASLPQFQAARSRFPQTIDGFNFVDFQKFDWPGLKEHWLKELKKSSGSNTTKALDGQKATPAAPADIPAWLDRLDPQVFARHLHSAFAASWKDSRGFHFEQWLD